MQAPDWSPCPARSKVGKSIVVSPLILYQIIGLKFQGNQRLFQWKRKISIWGIAQWVIFSSWANNDEVRTMFVWDWASVSAQLWFNIYKTNINVKKNLFICPISKPNAKYRYIENMHGSGKVVICSTIAPNLMRLRVQVACQKASHQFLPDHTIYKFIYHSTLIDASCWST